MLPHIFAAIFQRPLSSILPFDIFEKLRTIFGYDKVSGCYYNKRVRRFPPYEILFYSARCFTVTPQMQMRFLLVDGLFKLTLRLYSESSNAKAKIIKNVLTISWVGILDSIMLFIWLGERLRSASLSDLQYSRGRFHPHALDVWLHRALIYGWLAYSTVLVVSFVLVLLDGFCLWPAMYPGGFNACYLFPW